VPSPSAERSETWVGRSVLVTGAGGFIGSHLVELLLDEGADVRGFVRYTSAAGIGNLRFLRAEQLAAIELVAGDLRDADAVRQAVAGCDSVFHLGALIAIPYSYVHPREVIETNVIGTLNVLEGVRDAGLRRLVHVSTSEVYGTAQYVPIDERHPLQGQSPYSASKIGADKVAESFARSFDLPIITVRPFNTFGPRQSARAVIPTIISQVLAGRELKLGALQPTRDFTFVTDTARGMVLAADAPPSAWEEINLGTGQEITIGDLAQRIMDLTGRTVPIVEQSVRLRPSASEVQRLCSDPSRAREALGWEPHVALDEGLRRTIDWISEHRELFQPDEYRI